jgi:CAAX protease family protein
MRVSWYEKDNLKMEARVRFPYRFFFVTFLWSWMIWLPLVLAALHIIPIGQEFLAKANFPALVLAAFGPAVGALYSLGTLKGKEAVRSTCRVFSNFGSAGRSGLHPSS